MKRIDKIKNYILDELKAGKTSYTASEIANALEIQRCDASTDLNKLYLEGFLFKEGKRPVYYTVNKAFFYTEDDLEDDLFEDEENSKRQIETLLKEKSTIDYMIDTSPSLKKAWQLAKTAISYPPHGLNTLITGQTGVGKSFLAEAMWEYAKQNDTFKKGKDIPFVSFNCAEYADNPQLLLSRLFGHAKGSFTGADTDKAGLIKDADGGILFLDEIHRLPPTGQEMLFSIIDNSTYRALGENSPRKISVMIICATTENPSNVLLDTYLRRFPVHIHIPNLSERTPKERLRLITNFITNEAITLNYPIYVSGLCLKSLISYDAKKGNIGEIKNIINLCCAKSYLKFITQEASTRQLLPASININTDKYLAISPYELPQYVTEDSHSMKLPENFGNLHIFEDGIVIFPYRLKKDIVGELDEKYNFNLYSYIQKKIDTYKDLDLPQFDINVKILQDLDNYYTNIIQRFENTKDENTKLVYGIIAPIYYELAQSILKEAEMTFQRSYSPGIYVAFALHLQEFHARIEEGKIIYNPSLEGININLANEMEFLKNLRPKASQKLNVAIPDDELGFWAKFISRKEKESLSKTNISILVVCHGEHLAFEYAQLINKMMATDCVHAVDASLNMTFDEVFTRILETVKQLNSQKGILIFADMGSLVTIEKQLIEKTGIYIRVLPIVCAPILLEAAKSVTLSDESIDSLYEQLFKNYTESIKTQYEQTHSKISTKLNSVLDEKYNKYIITICSTGYGSAMATKTLLEEKLCDFDDLKIIALSLDEDIMPFINLLKDKLKMIIGGINPSVANIPFISIEQIFTSKGTEKIKSILCGTCTKEILTEPYDNILENVFPLIAEKFSAFAPDVDPDKLRQACISFYAGIKDIIGYDKAQNIYVNLILHFICMIQRLEINNTWTMPSFGREIITNKQNYYHRLKTLLESICNPIGYKINDVEMAYFLVLL